MGLTFAAPACPLSICHQGGLGVLEISAQPELAQGLSSLGPNIMAALSQVPPLWFQEAYVGENSSVPQFPQAWELPKTRGPGLLQKADCEG